MFAAVTKDGNELVLLAFGQVKRRTWKGRLFMWKLKCDKQKGLVIPIWSLCKALLENTRKDVGISLAR